MIAELLGLMRMFGVGCLMAFVALFGLALVFNRTAVGEAVLLAFGFNLRGEK